MGYLRGSDRDISYLKEVTPGIVAGTLTGTAPNEVTDLPFKLMRTTGDSFDLTRDTFQSNELRSDRGVVDLKSGNKQAAGSVDFEFSYENFEDMLEAALESADTLSVATDSIMNGTTMTSFSIEKGFPNGSHYQLFTGMFVNTFSLNIAANSQVTGSVAFIGMDQEVRTIAASSETATAPIAGGLFDSFTGSIKEGGSVIGDITSLSLTINNGLTPTFVLMNDGVKEVIDGRCMVEGSISLYFANATMYNKFVNDELSSIEFTLTDSANSPDGYTFLLPRVKYKSASMPVSGEGPVTVTMPFQALQDATNGTIKVTKN